MKLLSWNVRVLGNPQTVRRLRHSLKQHHPQVVFLMETKLNKNGMEKVRRSCGFQFGIDVDSIGSKGGLSQSWLGKVNITLRSFSNRHIDVFVEEGEVGKIWRLTGFYGSPYSQDRNAAWNLLRQLRNQGDYPWLVCGDFNEILYGFEKKGGLPREERRMEAFRQVLDDCNLVDLGYSGWWFTWERGNFLEINVQERLDRGLATEQWSALFPNNLIRHLPHSFSDQCPILLDTAYKNGEAVKRKFKFEAWWVLEETFFSETKRIWENSTGDLVNKLEILKKKLEKWGARIQSKNENRGFDFKTARIT
ncbi:uncharacterized protein [Gossypium hirsutum]|uniref:Endonuclease/exonuclease/phosphatase domain-containing protein n=1 Tax=Gossypium hirsutum TaxID=3635 RepID=A0ABM3AMQ2_GOSHI|nr:uncharacterized protein LOC121220755 [Gossypium hirsutum]